MSTPPLVSYTIVSFNQAKYLEHAIQSVISQTYPSTEILVVDGGSTDGSVDIIRKYEHQLTWWVSEPDSGPEEAVNKGLKQSKGKYFNFIPSDDALLPGATTRLVDYLENNPDASGVFGNYRFIDHEGIAICDRFDIPFDRRITLYAFNNVCQVAGLFKRDAIARAGGMNEQTAHPSDLELWLRIDRMGGWFGFVEDLVAEFRFHPSSKSSIAVVGEATPLRRGEEFLDLKREYGWSCKLLPVETTGYLLLALWFRAVRKYRQLSRYGKTNIVPASRQIRKELKSMKPL